MTFRTTLAASVTTVFFLGCFPSLPEEDESDTAQVADDTTQTEGDAAEPPGDATEADAGGCAGPADCSHLDGPCVVGACVANLCEVAHRAAGASCDDGLFCTVDDACDAGVCVGSPRTCAAPRPCATATCDEGAGACVVDDGACTCVVHADCDDNNPCNGAETCGADGQCRPGASIVCPASSHPCRVNVCQPEDGACVPVAAHEGQSCSDGAYCTVADVCVDGACEGGPRDCDDGRECTVDTCSETLDACVNDPTPCGCATDADCDDGNPCNGSETCGPDDTCLAGIAVTCEPSTTACKRSQCNPSTGACHLVDDDEATCDDGDACTVNDSCAAGQCVGAPKPCDDGVSCTADSCAAGTCVHTPTASCECRLNADCVDGETCNGNETCHPSTFTCLPGTPLADDAPCDDGAYCTINDRCAAGACVGDPRVCDDGIACSVVNCSESQAACVADLSGCECAGADDTTCDDGDPCNGVETCSADKRCLPGTPVSCPASTLQCKKNVCDPETGGCALVDDDGVSCEDGDLCTTNDTCLGGNCLAQPVVCDDGIACTDDSCSEATGECRFKPGPSCECVSDADCDDGEECSGVERCDATTLTCLPGAPLANGTPCDDGLYCTVSDQCSGEVCVGSSRDCGDAYACTVDSCDEEANVCVNDATGCACLTASDCDDNNACNGVETCSTSGQCLPGTPVSCTQPVNPCQQALCDPVTGQCYFQPRASGSWCEDGDACTLGDTCQSGQCVSGVSVPCTTRALATGWNHTCVQFGGDIRCWGQGTRLGYEAPEAKMGDNEPASATALLEFERPAILLGGGYSHTCTIFSNGRARCWGADGSGRLGNPSSGTDAVNGPDVLLPTGVYTQVAAGMEHSCALRSDGDLWCWGGNSGRQLGYPGVSASQTVTTPSFQSRVSVGSGLRVAHVATGQHHTCALIDPASVAPGADNVKCWGSNGYGQLGYGGAYDSSGTVVLPSGVGFVSLGAQATALAVGANHSCALLTNSQVRCWGRNNAQQLGWQGGPPTATATPAPAVNLDGTTATKLRAGQDHTCVVTTTGGVRCWGKGLGGRLGSQSSTDSASSIAVNVGATVVDVAPGDTHTCALLTNGHVRCWGSNLYGQLGYGTGIGVLYGGSAGSMPPPNVPYQ